MLLLVVVGMVSDGQESGHRGEASGEGGGGSGSGTAGSSGSGSRPARCPEYLCSRPVKNVHLYKKALALSKQNTNSAEEHDPWDDWEAWADVDTAEREATVKTRANRRRVTTQMSDVELYERRTWYWFWPYGETKPSPYLPLRETPEEQLQDMSVFDFFRFVRYHGGLAMSGER